MRAPRDVAAWAAVAIAITGSGIAGCGGEGTEPQPAPATLQATTATGLSASVGSAIAVGVIVRDAGGAPMRDVQVSFSVSQGAGSVTPSSAATDGTGIASGAWTLGTVAGQNELRVVVIGLSPVVFTAAAQAGPPSVLEKVSGDQQQGPGGAVLPAPLRVKVVDAHANLVTGATVTFAVSSGGGSIGSSAVSGSDGLASALWTLGAGGGAQRVTASIGTLSVLFTASATVVDPCPAAAMTVSVAPITVGACIIGALTTDDRQADGSIADRYELAIEQPVALAISMTSSAFTPDLAVSSSTGAPIASSRQVAATEIDYCTFPGEGCLPTTTSKQGDPVTLFAAPGSRAITATSGDGKATGSYRLSVAQAPNEVSECRTVFLERGVTISQQLQATDCNIDFGGIYYSDAMKIHLTAGSQLRIRFSSSAFTPWLDLYSPTGEPLGTCVNAGTAECTFAIQSSGYHVMSVSSLELRRPGAYTLTVN